MGGTDFYMNLIAFDQSTTATGWCVMDMSNSKIVAYGVIRPLGTTNERIIETLKTSIKLCNKFEVAAVFIEGTQVQRNPKVFEVLAKLQGIMEVSLVEKGYYVNIVKASEWRKRIGIKNRKRELVKQEALEMVEDLYRITPSEDECEAILFARAYCALEG